MMAQEKTEFLQNEISPSKNFSWFCSFIYLIAGKRASETEDFTLD